MGEKDKYKCKRKKCLANFRGRCALEPDDMENCIPAETNYLFRYGTIKTKADAIRAYGQGRRYHDQLKREAEKRKKEIEFRKQFKKMLEQREEEENKA